MALNNYSFIYFLLSEKKNILKLSVGEFRTSESEENMHTYISTQWLRGGHEYLLTNKLHTGRQERSRVTVSGEEERKADQH